MAAFWNNLQWPKVVERYAFIAVVVNVSMCVQMFHISKNLCDMLSQKSKHALSHIRVLKGFHGGITFPSNLISFM